MAISQLPQPVAVKPPQGITTGPALGVITKHPALRKRIDNTILIGVPFAGSVANIFWLRSHPIHIVEVVTFVVGYFIIGMGTGVGFHRYFSHKSFQTYPWGRFPARRGRLHVFPKFGSDMVLRPPASPRPA